MKLFFKRRNLHLLIVFTTVLVVSGPFLGKTSSSIQSSYFRIISSRDVLKTSKFDKTPSSPVSTEPVPALQDRNKPEQTETAFAPQLDRSVLRYQEELGKGPTFEIVHGQEAAWELPKGQLRGVVAFGHGCFHAGYDPWTRQSKCPVKCVGLPEEVMWRRAALARGLVVIGISSQERSKDIKARGCWFEVKKDNGTSAARVIRTVIRRLKLQHLPLYVAGASSGAILAMSLPWAMPEIVGVYSQVRGLPIEKFQLPDGRKYPPIAFVHMAKGDNETAQLIAENIEVLKAAGTLTAQTFIDPRPVTIEFLTARGIGAITPAMASSIIRILREHGYIDSHGMLTRNPRPVTEQWAKLIKPVVGNLSLVRDRSNLGELLNVARARHEFIHDYVDAVFEWLEHKGKGGQQFLDELVLREMAAEAKAAEAWAEQLQMAGFTQ